MIRLTAQQKHDILVHIRNRRNDENPVTVAAQYGVILDRKTVWRWQQKWTGTPQSLEHRRGAGRSPILTPVQVTRYIHRPILAANRSHRAINYPKIHQLVQEKTGKSISLRTIQSIGHDKLHARKILSRKRTRDECK